MKEGDVSKPGKAMPGIKSALTDIHGGHIISSC